MTNVNQKEYLKKYLKIGAKTGDKKKKKKSDKTSGTRMKIIDDDIDTILSKEIQDDIDAANEDAPQIVAVIDERPHSLIVDEKTKSSLWKPIGQTLTSSEFKNFKIGSIKLNKHRDDLDKNKLVTSKSKSSNISDLPSTSTYNNMSPIKTKDSARKDNGNVHLREGKYSYDETDYSPPRTGQDYSPPRNRDQSHSPQRIDDQDCSSKRKDKKDHEKDYSPLRKKDKDYSPPRKRNLPNSPSRKNCQDHSIQRKEKDHEKDYSPPRRKDNDYSPSRKRIQSDSPSRKKDQDYSSQRKEKDYSPPRRKDKGYSPPRKRNQSYSPSRKKGQDGKDYSPPRRKDNDYSPPKKDQDYSPQRKHKDSKFHVGTSKEQDYSPPRKMLKVPTSPSRRDKYSPPRNKEKDQSPPRVNHHSQREKCSSPSKDKSRKKQSRWGRELSPASAELKKPETTMSGKKSGLQNAKNLVEDIARLQKEEEELFKTMSSDVSGANATTIVRKKKQEEVVDPDKEAREQELKKKYCVWGKGLKQVQDESERYAEQQREMSKPLARYADDEDLERYLKEQEREGDPMLAYIRKKKKKIAVEQGIPEKPMYMGDFMPNRFGIRPGYRWDGVDRSNGYEKKWFETQNAKKAMQEEATKWSTEDM